MSTTTPVYAVNAKLVLKEERRDDFLSVITHDQKQTLSTEPGALSFVIGQDPDSSNTFYLHEQYKSKADFDHHCTTEHFKKWDAFCKENPFASNPVIDLYNILQTE